MAWREILAGGLLLCLLGISKKASAYDESLSFTGSPNGGFQAVVSGISDGPDCHPEFQQPSSVAIEGTSITISSPVEETGCFIPFDPRPYQVIAALGQLSGDHYEVVWTQPGLPDLTGVLVPSEIGNLVPNPEFEGGLDGWSLASDAGSIAIDDQIGVPEAPSLHVLGGAAQSSCIEIDDSVGVDVRVLGSGLADAKIAPYSDVDCTTALDLIAVGSLGPNNYWQTMSMTDVALPPGTQSVRVIVSAHLDSLDAPGDAHFDHIALGRTGTIPDGIQIKQEGLTGTWYNPATSGQGFEFVVDPGDATGGGSLFGAWYTYDVSGASSGQRWYSLQAILPSGATSADLTIFRNTGGNFAAPPTTSAVPVGTGTVIFYTCTSGLLTYAFDSGLIGSIPIHSLMQNVECDESGVPATPPPASDFGLSGSWYDPDTSGQGFMVNINPENAQAFFGWYTYAVNGSADSESGQRWFSAQAPYTVGTTTMDLAIYASTGGAFDSPGGVTTTPVGTATLTFTSCTEATLDYAFTAGEMSARSGTIALTRLGAPLASCGDIVSSPERPSAKR